MSLPPKTHIFFETLDECRTLDRLQLPPPQGHVPAWSLHVVQLRPKEGDRVYAFFGTSSVVGGAFALYPDDLWHTAQDIGLWHSGAWPYFRKTPGRFSWLKQPPGIDAFVKKLGPVSARDIPREVWSCDCWYLRFDEGGRTVRHFTWDDTTFPSCSHWEDLRCFCQKLAMQALRFPLQSLRAGRPR